MMLNTPRGSQSNAILYIICRNGQGQQFEAVWVFFRFLLDEIAESIFMAGSMILNDRAFLNDLLPWSDKLPDVCKKKI